MAEPSQDATPENDRKVFKTEPQQSFNTEESSSCEPWRNDVSPTLEATRLGQEEEYGEITSSKGSCDGKDDGGPTTRNETHPLLESPLLYYVLRRSPTVLEGFRHFYSLRWRLSYRLQHRVPFRLGVHATWGELLLLAPFFIGLIVAIFGTSVSPTIAGTGRVARLGIVASLVLAQRNSFVTFLLGIPVNRAVFYHKLAGYFTSLTGLLHTVAFFLDPINSFKYRSDAMGGAFDDVVNTSGFTLLLCLIGLVISSLPVVRRYCFEFFFYLHYVFVLGLIVSAWFHSGGFLPVVAALTWGVDVVMRQVSRLLHPRRAQLRRIGTSVVELSFPKTPEFCYNPGQFVYLTVPEITLFQSHPFSISSAPCQGIVTIHIRVLGSWTSALYDLAQTKSRVDMRVEGPYGSLSVDVMGSDRKYKSALLISGGIGVAPMQSISDQLMYEYSLGLRELHRLKFVWVERDPILVSHAGTPRREDINHENVRHNNLAELLLVMFPPGSADESSVEPQSDENTLTDDERSSSDPLEPSCLVDIYVYLTGKQQRQEDMPPFARRGRPDMQEIFFASRKEAIKNGEKKVAVCVSAPGKLRTLVEKACLFFSDEAVRFDFHAESGEGLF